MKTPRLLLPIVLFAPVLAAQEHKITIKSTEGTRYTIESASKIETSRKMLVNGEEGGFGGGGGRRGGGGAQGPVSTTEKVVFIDGGGWRQYETAEAKVSRPGQDGETNEQTIAGELAGKKVTLGAEPAVLEGEKSTPLPPRSSRGLPAKIDLGGLAPAAAVSVGGTYEITGFHKAMASLVHPVRARMERPDGAGGGAGGDAAGRRGRRGEGGEGGGEARGQGGQGGRQGRGQAGGRGGFGAMGGGENPALRVLAAEGVQSKVTGKLAKVENDLATIEISGTVSGKGDPAKLGLDAGMGGMFGGRGGRGGAGGGEAQAPQGESDGSANVEVKGTLVVDMASGCIKSLEVTGQLQSKSNMVRSMDRNGETMEIETDTTQKGSFSLKVACAPAK